MTQTEAARGALTRAEAEDFLYAEAALLDEGRFEAWLELFTSDAVYWVPARLTETDPARTVSLIFDERPRIEERVWRLTHGPAHAQIPPSVTRRLISNVRVGPVELEAVTVRSNFAIFENRKDVQRSFAGEYEHRLRREGETWKVCLKKATLINCEAAVFNLTFMI